METNQIHHCPLQLKSESWIIPEAWASVDIPFQIDDEHRFLPSILPP